ncbi:hypothetical protein SMMN14_04594 [Sphaerulina musiva]
MRPAVSLSSPPTVCLGIKHARAEDLSLISHDGESMDDEQAGVRTVGGSSGNGRFNLQGIVCIIAEDEKSLRRRQREAAYGLHMMHRGPANGV